MTSIFAEPIGTSVPLAMFPRRDNHPVLRNTVLDNPELPIGTNNFYTNLMIGTQNFGSWPLPYMLSYSIDPVWHGVSVSHADADQFSMGPDKNANPVQFYISPIGIRSFVFAATEFNPSTTSVTLDSTTQLSANLNVHANRAQYGDSTKKITFPLVQGMGFITARYYNLVPVIASAVIFRNVTPVEAPRPGTQKFRVVLEDGKVWLVYVFPNAGTPGVDFEMEGMTKFVARAPFTGFIQIAKLSSEALEYLVDSAAGAFPLATSISGTVSGNTGSYTFKHTRYGNNNSGKLLMYALPHHMASFNSATLAGQTNLLLQSPTKGMMRGILGDSWTLIESGFPTGITWLPNGGAMSANVKAAIKQAASEELQQDMIQQTNLDSMYFSGKALGKFAQIVLALTISQQDPDLARSGLAKLEVAMERFTSNKQKFPLVYDRKWRGLVSDAIYQTGDPGVDFGNSHYNDHHFHYGYHIYAAAVIGYTERILNNSTTWLNTNKPWVNQLVRDVANPSAKDKYFPVSRSFDWWHGHSWAKGLFESGDGKDQESSSEDYNFAYSMKLWGMVIKDFAMEARANLMLGILKRTVNMYMLMANDNTTHPAQFIKNKVTGILFENKCDHATYFGANPEYIQGIHMIPLTPISPYIRSPTFVLEEWKQWFDNDRADALDSGWKGILMANYAIYDPKAAWSFFTQPGFSAAWLDGGASKTWYLAFVGGLGGA